MESLDKLLRDKIKELSDSNTYDDLVNKHKNLVPVYPFNQYEFIITNLIGLEKITLADYYKLRDGYIERNKYLELFEKSPRGFGETWAHEHLQDRVPTLQKPSNV